MFELPFIGEFVGGGAHDAPQTFPLGGRWIQKMSKSGHFLKTDEGGIKKSVPSSVTKNGSEKPFFVPADSYGAIATGNRLF